MSAAATTLAQLRSALERALVPSELEILDDSAAHAGHAGARGGGHYKVRVVAEAFRGRSQLERHRLVYTAVGPAPGARGARPQHRGTCPGREPVRCGERRGRRPLQQANS